MSFNVLQVADGYLEVEVMGRIRQHLCDALNVSPAGLIACRVVFIRNPLDTEVLHGKSQAQAELTRAAIELEGQREFFRS